MEVKPYSILARHYDRMMGHVEYGQWAQSLQKILKRHKCKVSRLLELGAGTCNLAKSLAWPELKVRIHTDLSFEMVRAAGADFPYARAACDATKLPFASQSFDFVLMSYDAVNYLDEAQLRELFEEVSRVLIAGGVFLFDITTETNSLEWFVDYSDAFEAEGNMLVRRSSYDQENRIQHNWIDVFSPEGEGMYKRNTEHHEQYIHTVPLLCACIEDAGLQVADLLDATTLRQATPKSERIHFFVVAP